MGPGVLDALSALAGYADRLGVVTARDTHRALSRRTAGWIGHGGRGEAETGRIYDLLCEPVYAGVGGTLRLASTGLGRAGSLGLDPPLEGSRRGRLTRAAVNGILGDRLEVDHPRLAIDAAVRVDGADLPLDPACLAHAFPGASPRVVVFVHGLVEDETCWSGTGRPEAGSYPSRLAHVGWTPVFVRLNTGLALAENGVRLTGLLQALVDGWPCRVDRVALVGHSMGGLVVRSGCAVATPAARPWTDLVTDVVTLGTPHHGADLARGVGLGGRLLARTAESAAWGRLLDHRSAAVVDLERGLPDLDALPGVRYRLVSGAVGPAGGRGGRLAPVVGHVLGDLLVRRGSATARSGGHPLVFEEAELLHVPGAGHFALLDHPVVAEALARWLGERPAGGPAVGAPCA